MRVGGGGEYELDGEGAAAGESGAVDGVVADAGDVVEAGLHFGRMSNTVRVRSPQGFKTMPPKELAGWVMRKVRAVSGWLRKNLLAAAVEMTVCSRVPLAGVCAMARMTPWSSAGASSLGERMNMGTAARESTIQTMYTAGRA